MQGKKEMLTPRSQKEKHLDKVKVILRIRPFVEIQEEEEFITQIQNHSISINKPGFTSYMKFSYVQNSYEAKEHQDFQKDIFNAVDEAVKCIFDGIDSTIFAYGQTGAGKTYAVIGNCPENNSDFDFYKTTLCSPSRGILPRSLQMIFQEQKRKKNSRITISFYEIYNQKIYDLLSNNMKSLQIRQSKNGEITIHGLSSIEVLNMKEVINYLAEGIKNRATSSTSSNIKSSRSHSIFHVKYQKLVLNAETKEHQVVVANLRVVDLAGSEKFNISQDISASEKEIKLLELKSINGSLSKLGHCISSLSNQSRTHIPVRDSKLTRILSESLLGSGKIRIIICVSPSISSMNQTSSTLQFADRVKKAIFQKPAQHIQKKRTIDYEEYLHLVEQLEHQKKKRIQLQKMVSEMKLSPGQAGLIKQNDKLKTQIVSLKQQLKIYGNQDKINSSRLKGRESFNNSIKRDEKKSLSPQLQSSKKMTTPIKTNYQHFAQKSRSTSPLNQDNYINPKAVNTPPKTHVSKSINEVQSKSQKYSVEDHSLKGKHVKRPQQKSFESKIKLFMQRRDIDNDLQQKVKKRLIEIKQQISKDNKEWLHAEGEEDCSLLWNK